ncbi:MAG: hypothetical protein KatS3mg109_0601 [Pirellulaceae bacterium]|nr:MAG: hypothetical protein KatS3mg109_0601 [Pirellulaceae bacterium]
MATYRLRRFSRPETLKAIAPERLYHFLRPHGAFLLSRGVALPQSSQDGELDYDKLVQVFMTPDSTTPKELIDALYYVDEMATSAGMDALLDEAAHRGLPLPPGCDHSPADIAVYMWLRYRDIVERKHAERYLTRIRSFDHYQMDRSCASAMKHPTDAQLAVIARELDDWFEEKKRGRGSRIIACEKDGIFWFLVRHGEPFKREESLDGDTASTVHYRPLRYDVVVYVPQTFELWIHARSVGEKQLYLAKFGKHLFGNENAFPGAEKYTLQPLRQLGEDALAPGDVTGIEWIKLREVQFYYGGEPWELVTHKCDDYFDLLKSKNRTFPASGRIVKATFQVKFSDAKTPRSVVIKPPNIAQFTRDDDSELVERWLEVRGFIIKRELAPIEQPGKIVASA